MRFFITLLIAKIGYACIQFLRLGSGFTWPGHVALKLYPRILSDKRIQFPKGIVLITGTNGKTTTAKLTKHIIEECGETVIHNKTGGNLVNGIVSTILLQMSWSGRLPGEVGVFEVDEFTLPHVLQQLSPIALVLLNLSRDQLDRYGETDTIVERWAESILELPKSTTLIMYRDQPEFDRLEEVASCRVKRFSIDEEIAQHLKIQGSFNKKNATAAVLASHALGFVDNQRIHRALNTFTSAYGRGEVISYKEKEFSLFLAKNPASFDHNVELLHEFDPKNTALWFILNDNIPDGRDVSWIYDVQSTPVREGAQQFSTIAVSGTRALDMAVRLNYAGVEITKEQIYSSHEQALQQLLDAPEKNILVLPNYSAMLEIRKLLTGQSIL